MNEDECKNPNCEYVGTHKHGHICDFTCGCEQGQNFPHIRE